MTTSPRVRGAEFLVVTCVLEALFPVIAHYASSNISPLFFYAAGIFCAACVLGIHVFVRGEFHFRLKRIEWFLVLGIVFTIVALGMLIFIATKMTSSINTAILLQTEMLFAFLWGHIIFKEKHRWIQGIGVLSIFSGTLLTVFNGSFSVNLGDLLLIIVTFIAPLGNACTKRALKTISVPKLLFLRYSLGCLIVIPVAFLFDDFAAAAPRIYEHLWLLTLYVFLILFVSKLFWYAALRSLKLSIATSIMMVAPALSIIFSFLFLGEQPTPYQLGGLVCALVGVFLLLRNSKVPQTPTDLV